MDRILSFVFIAWLSAMAFGIVIALLPLLAFLAGFLGMILLISFVAGLVCSWLFH